MFIIAFPIHKYIFKNISTLFWTFIDILGFIFYKYRLKMIRSIKKLEHLYKVLYQYIHNSDLLDDEIHSKFTVQKSGYLLFPFLFLGTHSQKPQFTTN